MRWHSLKRRTLASLPQTFIRHQRRWPVRDSSRNIEALAASFAHTTEDIATYLGAFDEMLGQLKRAYASD